jgi:hypothetical protein
VTSLPAIGLMGPAPASVPTRSPAQSVGGDGQLASASLVSGATPAVGQIKPLFPIRTIAQPDATNHYRVSHDAQRVLVLGDRVEDERGATLVLNWPQLIGRSAR